MRYVTMCVILLLAASCAAPAKSGAPALVREVPVTVIVPQTVVVYQTVAPVATRAPVAPTTLTFSGTGQQATAKFTATAGLVVFEMSHSGRRNFVVWLVDGGGQRVDLLANTIGSFNGSKATRITTGTYLLDVQADGAWQIKTR